MTESLPPELLKPVIEIEIRLKRSKKKITNSRILAELNFGFWTTLFYRQYAKLFWKPLHQIFRELPPQQRKRTTVSGKLNHIRNFRNRIYHYEPIIWDLNELKSIRKEISETLTWLDSDTEKWLANFDTLPEVLGNKE